MSNNQWLPENSVADSEIELMSQKGAVKAFHITEHDEKELYYVTLYYTWRAELLHLSTRRVKTEPKMWTSLDRLIAHIKTKFPRIRKITLTLRDRTVQKVVLTRESESAPASQASVSAKSSEKAIAKKAKTKTKPNTKAPAKASKSLSKVSSKRTK